MPRKTESRIKLNQANSNATEPPSSVTAIEDLSADQLTRWAHLIAKGEAGFPENPSAAQLRLLIAEVRKLRRNRLTDYIAQMIAHDIARSRGP